MRPQPEGTPATLRMAYDAASTERERETAAMAIARHHASLVSSHAGRDYTLWNESTRRYGDWFQIAARHRGNHVAQRVPSPYDRPLLSPRDAAARHLWAYRSWDLRSVRECSGSSGGAYGAYSVSHRGEWLRVEGFAQEPCSFRIEVRELWHEMFDAARDVPVQLSLFAAVG